MSNERLTLVHDIPVKKFMEVLNKSAVNNRRFDVKQFEKNFNSKDMVWCILFNDKRECVAAANMQPGFGPADESNYINELMCLKSSHGYGKKLLQLLKKKYHLIWLCVDVNAENDSLLKFYRDPSFGFSEYVIPAEDSIYGRDIHVFAIDGITSRNLWMKFLLKQFGKRKEDAEKGKTQNA